VTRVRVSLSFFNNARDVDRFLEVSETRNDLTSAGPWRSSGTLRAR
jgi:hypothetical protein